MSLLKKMMQEQKDREALVAAEADIVEKPQEDTGVPLELLAGKGKHQLVLTTDQTCPNCTAPMQDLQGAFLPLKVCTKCRIALPGQTAEEIAGAKKEMQVINMKGDVEERIVEDEEEKEMVRHPVENEQTHDDEHGEKIPTQNPQTGDNNVITEPPPPKETEDGELE